MVVNVYRNDGVWVTEDSFRLGSRTVGCLQYSFWPLLRLVDETQQRRYRIRWTGPGATVQCQVLALSGKEALARLQGSIGQNGSHLRATYLHPSMSPFQLCHRPLTLYVAGPDRWMLKIDDISGHVSVRLQPGGQPIGQIATCRPASACDLAVWWLWVTRHAQCQTEFCWPPIP